jgi:hypothetical protein
MQSQFTKIINNAYKNLLLEQEPGLNAPASVSPPTAAPSAPAGAVPTPAPEAAITDKAVRSSSDAVLIGLIAKALLINLDDDDKHDVIKYLRNLNTENASEIEENLVNLINSSDYQNLDIENENVFEIDPNKARKALNFLKGMLDKKMES